MMNREGLVQTVLSGPSRAQIPGVHPFIMADQVDENTVKELLPFLSLDARGDVKAIALDYMLGLSGSDSGKKFLKENGECLKRLLDLTKDSDLRTCGVAFSALVNLSAEQVIAEKLLQYNFIEQFLVYMLKPNSEHAGKAAMILSNITRTENGCSEVLKVTKNSAACGLYKIVEVLCKENYNPHSNLQYIATFINNLTQVQEFRDLILDKDRCIIQRLLPFTTYNASVIKRGGIVGTLKNCCFETGECKRLGGGYSFSAVLVLFFPTYFLFINQIKKHKLN